MAKKELQQKDSIQNYFKNYHLNTITDFCKSCILKKHLSFKFDDIYKNVLR